jgi:hypothetical protein
MLGLLNIWDGSSTKLVSVFSGYMFGIPAFIATVFYFAPNLFPFFAPAKGPATYDAGFLG